MDLSRTANAIVAYDVFNESLDFSKMNQAKADGAFAELERLAEAVGLAYGQDTAKINNVDTCRMCIRPGHKVPGPGCELSFVRRMVAKWEKEKKQS